MSQAITTKLQNLIDNESRKSNTYSVLLGVQADDERVNFQGAAGDAKPDSPYFIASVTKMYTAASVMGLVDEGRIDLDKPLLAYLPDEMLKGVHVYKGTDYGQQLKVYHLLSQTSGIADYFEGGIADDLRQNRDFAYTITDALAMVREKSASAIPESGKAYYSDTNYQLLGAIVESVTERTLTEVFQTRIFEPLALAQTYVFDHTMPRDEPIPMYYKGQRLDIPLAMSNMASDGGIVSTLSESLRFLRAYFGGELFDTSHFDRMQSWNPLFFPMQYGYGLMRFKLPGAMTLFRYTPELIGHSGTSASFAFYAPREGVYMAGTFNQLEKPSRPFQFLLKVASMV